MTGWNSTIIGRRMTISVIRNLDERLQQVECGIDRDVKNLISQRRLAEWRNNMNQYFRRDLLSTKLPVDDFDFPKGCMKKKESTTQWKSLYAKSNLISIPVGEGLDLVGEKWHVCAMRRSVRQRWKPAAPR